MMLKDLIFFPNGNVAAFDENSQQMGDIQAKGWMELFFEFLEQKGHDPTKVHIEAQLNGGVWKRIIPFKVEFEDGQAWNIQINDDIKPI